MIFLSHGLQCWYLQPSYYIFIGVRVSCRISSTVVSYLYIRFGELITSAWNERVYFSAIDYLYICGVCSEGTPFPLGALDRLHYFIVALSGFQNIICQSIVITTHKYF